MASAPKDDIFRLCKQRILVYYHCKSCVQIACCLAEEGYSVTNVGIAKFLPRYKETGSISRKPGMGRVTKITANNSH